MNDDISIDIETLGVRWDAPVIAIGAQAFDIKTGKLGSTFYQLIELGSAMKAGRIDAKTLQWWLKQDQAARQQTFSEDLDRLDLASTLLNFTTWVRAQSAGARVWGNGATFDIGILEHAYDVGCVGLKEGWYFTNVRDMRTLMDMAEFEKLTVKFTGTAHNALNDATHQAKLICAAWAKVKKAIHGGAVPAGQEDDEL